MRDISYKPTTLRTARAAGFVTLPPDVVRRVRGGDVEKGDVLETARIAGLMAVKSTPALLPHCHPIGVMHAELRAQLSDSGVALESEVESIAATGVEMEALTAVSIAALTVYDMLKAYASAEQMQIETVHLLEKRGGKSQYVRIAHNLSAAVIVLSDSIAAHDQPDTAGPVVRNRLADAGFNIAAYEILPNEPVQLDTRIRHHLEKHVDCIVTIGSTGLSPRDIAVATVEPLITTLLPGFMEAIRSFGQQRQPYALLSRGIAGLSGGSFIVTFPGSRQAAEVALAAVMTGLVHLLELRRA